MSKIPGWLKNIVNSCWGQQEADRSKALADTLIQSHRDISELTRGKLPSIKSLTGFGFYFEKAEGLFLRSPQGQSTFIPPYDEAQVTEQRGLRLSTYAVGPTSIAIIDRTGEMYLAAKSVPLEGGSVVPMEVILERHGFRSGGWTNPVNADAVPLTREKTRVSLKRYDTKVHARFQRLLGRNPLPLQNLQAIAGDRRSRNQHDRRH